jgi:predicted small lipoprotein YifL
MTTPHRTTPNRPLAPAQRAFRTLAALATLATALVACGGDSPFENPDTVRNPPGATGQKLSFAFFQRCINPLLNTPLPVRIGGVTTLNTCAAAGCHDNASGTGGALRLFGSAPAVDLSLAPDTIRASDMYKNFYSSLGESVVGSADASRMLNKPLVRGVLHGGGLIFDDPNTPEARLIRYWINRPMPAGQDEFSPAAATMFTPADPATGACNAE